MFIITTNAEALARRNMSWFEEVVCVVCGVAYSYLRQETDTCSRRDLTLGFISCEENASFGLIFSDFVLLLRATLVAKESRPKLEFLLHIRLDLVQKNDVLVPSMYEARLNPRKTTLVSFFQ